MSWDFQRLVHHLVGSVSLDPGLAGFADHELASPAWLHLLTHSRSERITLILPARIADTWRPQRHTQGSILSTSLPCQTPTSLAACIYLVSTSRNVLSRPAGARRTSFMDHFERCREVTIDIGAMGAPIVSRVPSWCKGKF